MTEATRVNRDILFDIEYVHAMLVELDDNSTEWEELTESDRVGWSLDWDQMVAVHLASLQQAHDRGAMTPEQAAAYDDLLRRLRERLPVIQRQRLWVPPMLLRA